MSSDFSRARGILQIGDRQFETYTCVHCNRVRIPPVDLQGRPIALDMCQRCAGPVCLDSKFCHEHCTPHERELEKIEAGISRQRFRAMI